MEADSLTNSCLVVAVDRSREDRVRIYLKIWKRSGKRNEANVEVLFVFHSVKRRYAYALLAKNKQTNRATSDVLLICFTPDSDWGCSIVAQNTAWRSLASHVLLLLEYFRISSSSLRLAIPVTKSKKQ
jgi:hypothetical protein